MSVLGITIFPPAFSTRPSAASIVPLQLRYTTAPSALGLRPARCTRAPLSPSSEKMAWGSPLKASARSLVASTCS